MVKGLVKAYKITVSDFEKSLRATPWYMFGTRMRLQHDLNYFRERLEKAIQEEEEYGSK